MSLLFIKTEKGQGLTEYAIILSLIAVASIAATAFFGGAIKAKIAALAGAISGQDIAKINESEKKSKSAADKAQKNASTVTGNTSIKKDEDIFDKETL
ncbi:Flp family type IVb pilin [Fluviispira vulneris]|uniref:Flp family type IVb pilin n=1 Tax=Fluviispira vulneris TaxID=2763012 RepID=UPI0016481BC7|nr:pilus assembly protein [Fluviispira vulneris]